MKPIVYMNADIKNSYEDNSLIGRIKDRFRISFLGESFIEELGLSITNVKLPPNLDKKAYYTNVGIAMKRVKNKNVSLAPKIYRQLDYNFFNNFQKELMAFGIARSSKLILRTRNKSIRESCIVIYDAADDINFRVICNVAKEAKYIVLLSKDIIKISRIGEYIVANYGITPIITCDIEYALRSADIIITSKGIELNSRAVVWYLNNKYIPIRYSQDTVNDVTYNVPWDFGGNDMSPELLGSILCQMEETDVEKALKYNGIFLDKIKFNDNTLVLEG